MVAIETSQKSTLSDILTPSEMQILRLVACALTNKAIAERLSITKSGVVAHLNNVYRKLGIQTTGRNPRVSAVLIYQMHCQGFTVL